MFTFASLFGWRPNQFHCLSSKKGVKKRTFFTEALWSTWRCWGGNPYLKHDFKNLNNCNAYFTLTPFKDKNKDLKSKDAANCKNKSSKYWSHLSAIIFSPNYQKIIRSLFSESWWHYELGARVGANVIYCIIWKYCDNQNVSQYFNNIFYVWCEHLCCL